MLKLKFVKHVTVKRKKNKQELLPTVFVHAPLILLTVFEREGESDTRSLNLSSYTCSHNKMVFFLLSSRIGEGETVTVF